MIRRALYRTERRPVEATEAPRMRLALGKKPYAQPLAAPLRQHNGFGAIKDAPAIPTLFDKGLLELVRLICQRQGRGRTNHLPLVLHQHTQAVGATQISRQVLRFILAAAVVQIGKLAKHADAQIGQRINPGRDLLPAEQLNVHAKTRCQFVSPASVPALAGNLSCLQPNP